MTDFLLAETPVEWRRTSLAVACSDGGGIQTGPFGSQLHASDYVADGIPSVMPQDLGENVIRDGDIARITPEDAQRLSKYLLCEGDIVYSRRGDVTRRALVRSEQEGWLCGTGCLRVRPGNGVDSLFLSYYLGHPEVRTWIVRHAVGATMPNLNTQILGAVPVVLPELDEQRRMAAVLGALDDKIAVNERIATAADQLVNAYFREAFNQALNHVESGLPLPSAWAVSTIGATTTVVETGNRPKGGVAQYSSGVPSIGAESIVGLGRFDFTKTKFVPRDFFAAMRRGVLEDRDILVYKDGGKPGDFRPHVTLFGNGFPFSEMCINEHVYRVRMRPQIGQEFGYYWLCSMPIMAEMRRRGTGAAIPGINSTAFKGVPLVVPPQEKVAAFKGVASPLIDRVLTAAVESRTLATLRDTLLPQLMSGRLRVKDAEKTVEEAT